MLASSFGFGVRNRGLGTGKVRGRQCRRPWRLPGYSHSGWLETAGHGQILSAKLGFFAVALTTRCGYTLYVVDVMWINCRIAPTGAGLQGWVAGIGKYGVQVRSGLGRSRVGWMDSDGRGT